MSPCEELKMSISKLKKFNPQGKVLRLEMDSDDVPSKFKNGNPAWYNKFCEEWDEVRFKILKHIEKEKAAKEKAERKNKGGNGGRIITE